MTRPHSRPFFVARLLSMPALAWLGLLAAGCGTTLEDGYKPHTLDATPDARKAYYASPFTDQAAAGAKEGSSDSGFHGGGKH
jgi:hypothetical protein